MGDAGTTSPPVDDHTAGGGVPETSQNGRVEGAGERAIGRHRGWSAHLMSALTRL